MPTIIDALNAQSGQAGALATQAGTGTTGRLQQILEQTSGKQPSGGVPTQNFGETAAVSQAKQAAGDAQGQQQLQIASATNEQARQDASGKNATAGVAQQASSMNQQFANQANQILSQYENGQKQLSLDEDKAGAQQLAFNMRLSNQEYTTRLEQEGQVRRLEDSTSFTQQTAEAVMGQELQTLQGKLDWQTAMESNQEQWNQDLQNIDLGTWMQMAKLGAAQANTTAATQGVGSLVQGGALAYSSGAFSSEPGETDGTSSGSATAPAPMQAAQNPDLPAGSMESLTYGVPTAGGQ